jgi:hypothetical protein
LVFYETLYKMYRYIILCGVVTKLFNGDFYFLFPDNFKKLKRGANIFENKKWGNFAEITKFYH